MAEKSSKTTKPRKKPVSTPRRASSAPSKPYTSTKPLFSMGTIITFVLFIAVILAAVFINRKNVADAAKATPTSGGALVFTAADGTPSDIKIEPAEGNAVELTRDTKNVWGLTLPIKTEANTGMAESAASQLAALNIDREISGDLDTFGLDKPKYVITVKFADGKTHTLEIGDPTPTNSGYYVRLDKGKMMIVSLSGVDALTQMTVSPPYLNTPAPTLTPVPPAATLAPVSDTPTSTP